MPGRKPPFSALISAEHASSSVPPRWAHLFEQDPDILGSHRGWDPGSAEVARLLAGRLQAPLLEGRVTRLLVDLNRSAGHPRHFSEFSRQLPAEDRQALVDHYWAPHWQRFRELIDQLPGQVVHIACHSFTPELGGKVRNTDLGLLYDPSRLGEKAWCRSLADCLRTRLPEYKVRLNYPYRGTSNGMGQQHRSLFANDKLITMELEVNSRWVDTPAWAGLCTSLVDSVATALTSG
jgi:predicted N-formylglutamate amidohydrolase